LIHTAIILAGGFGTRLQSVVADLPKPMAPVNGRPFIDYHLQYLKQVGFQKVILSTGHLAEKINAHYKNGFEGLTISFSHEATPLGTGGAIRLALEHCDSEEVLVLNGDSFFELPISDFISKHTHGSVPHSLALRQVADASRYGRVLTNSNHIITSFGEKDGKQSAGSINAGVYILNKEHYFDKTPAKKNFSIELDFFQEQATHQQLQGFEYDAYFIDIGIPEDYRKAQDDFKRFKY
jgi:D-glycero-alpha-D-manno-heptose 1-phosphate guanylyltransferase